MKKFKCSNELLSEIVDYLFEKEFDDYLGYCEEYDLDSDDYLNNASLKGAHIYAKIKALEFHILNDEIHDD